MGFKIQYPQGRVGPSFTFDTLVATQVHNSHVLTFYIIQNTPILGRRHFCVVGVENLRRRGEQPARLAGPDIKRPLRH